MDLTSFLIPAIDIRKGGVVRLVRGDFADQRTYNLKPYEVAEVFDSAGFRRIHVIDLDGALEGKPVNLKSISKIRACFRGYIQVGGGLRDLDGVKILFEEGIDYAIVGTVAFENRSEFEKIVSTYPGRIILSVDTRGGFVSIRGWRESSPFTPDEVLEEFESYPIGGYLCTVIERDGTLEGVDAEFYRRLRKKTGKPLLASGGVSSPDDIKGLEEVVDGVVVGRAIYEGRILIKGLGV